jgi:hypothetical protein
MSSDLVTYTPPSPAEWQQINELAKAVAATEFVPVAMRGKPAAVLACVLTGRELGIGPMQSLKHIAIIEGKPGLSAELMAGLVRSRGHKLRIITRSSDEAEVEGVRADDPQHPLRVRWTLKDAERAGLCTISDDGRPRARDRNNKPMPWEKYPDAVLLARAISALCRALFSDITAGFSYTPEEIESSNGSTEATWGEVEVDMTTGEVTDSDRLDGDSHPVQPVGPSVPTLEQIKRLRRPDDANTLIRQAGEDFGQLVERAVIDMHHPAAPRDWWVGSSISQRRDVLEYAVELADQQQHEKSAAGSDGPPAVPAADPTSDPGRAERPIGNHGEGRDSATTPGSDIPQGGDAP